MKNHDYTPKNHIFSNFRGGARRVRPPPPPPPRIRPCIGSFNVKGLADEKKRKEVFNWLRDKKMNVYMLQETHFTITDFKEVLAEERSFYKSLYSKNHTVYDNINEINNFFFPDDPEIPKLSEEDMLNCEGIISKDERVSLLGHLKMVNLQEQMDFLQNFIKYFGMMSLI